MNYQPSSEYERGHIRSSLPAVATKGKVLQFTTVQEHDIKAAKASRDRKTKVTAATAAEMQTRDDIAATTAKLAQRQQRAQQKAAASSAASGSSIRAIKDAFKAQRKRAVRILSSTPLQFSSLALFFHSFLVIPLAPNTV